MEWLRLEVILTGFWFDSQLGKIRKKRIDSETGETFPAWVKCMSDDVAKKEGYK